LILTEYLDNLRIFCACHLLQGAKHTFAVHCEIGILWVCGTQNELHECWREIVQRDLHYLCVYVVDYMLATSINDGQSPNTGLLEEFLFISHDSNTGRYNSIGDVKLADPRCA